MNKFQNLCCFTLCPPMDGLPILPLHLHLIDFLPLHRLHLRIISSATPCPPQALQHGEAKGQSNRRPTPQIRVKVRHQLLCTLVPTTPERHYEVSGISREEGARQPHHTPSPLHSLPHAELQTLNTTVQPRRRVACAR